MIKYFSLIFVFCLSISVFDTYAKTLIEHFKIEEGVATFTQEKHFSFLSKPIKSSGLFKVYKNNILWQVNSPVLSTLLIIDNQIWQYSEDANTTGNHYRKVIAHASIETLIKTIFTGKINKEQWNTQIKSDQCLVLQPKASLLAQAINELELCLGEQVGSREILVTDTQKNITKIYLTHIKRKLSDADVTEFNIH